MLKRSENRSCHFFKLPTLLFLLLIGHNSLGQNNHLLFNHLKATDGLKDRNIDFIKKDSKGCFWFSSMEGLHSYNGSDLKHYSTDDYPPNDNSGLLEKNIQSSFFEDSKGNIWFTTSNGIHAYIRVDDAFVNYFIKKENEPGYIDNDYSAFYLDNNDVLWLKANNTIYSFNTVSLTSTKFTQTQGVRFAIDTFANGQLKTIYACPWIMSPGIERLQLQQTTGNEPIVITQAHYYQNGLPNLPGLKPKVAHTIIENDTTIWLFSQFGLIKANPQNMESEVSIFTLPGVSDSHIKDGTIIDDNLIAVASKNHGLWIFDRKIEGFTSSLQLDRLNEMSLFSNDLREVYLDNEELLWVSYYDKTGISRAWINSNQFLDPMQKLGLEYHKIVSVAEDSLQQVWCASQKNGLFIFDKAGNFKRHIQYQKNLVPPVMHLHCSPQGQIWALCESGIYKFNDYQQERIITLSDKQLNYVYHLDSNRLLIGAIDSLFVYNKETFEINSFDYQSFYTQLSKDNKHLYLTTTKGELIILSILEEGLKQKAQHLLEADIYAICENIDDNNLILGTSKGAFIFDFDNKQIKNLFPEHHILKNIAVYSVTADDSGRYWLATTEGLWSFQPGTEDNIFVYHLEDGLPSLEFNHFSHMKSSNGKFWLGHNEGVLALTPLSIQPYPHKPKLELKDITVNDRVYKLDSLIRVNRKIELKSNENTFTIKALCISHYLPKFNSMAFQLIEYDKIERILKNDEVFSYTKLPPGQYTLKITPINANGVKGKERLIDITIKQHWTTRIEVIVGGLILLVGLIWGITKIVVVRRLKKQAQQFKHTNEIKEARQNERDRIASEMHEDLAGGLTSIQLLARTVRKQAQDIIVPEKLKRIEDYSAQLIEGMREIIWAMNSNFDNLADLSIYMKQFVLEYFENADIICKIDIPENLPQIIISGEKRKNLFLCLKESAHNVVKHAEATEVEFTIQYKANIQELHLKLQDNGNGINLNETTRFGNGMINMKKRMETIEGKMSIENLNGTLIKFVLPLSNDNKLLPS